MMHAKDETAMGAHEIFDENRIRSSRLRAHRSHQDGADFLLRLVADELADRLGVVERHFDHGVELHGYTGLAAKALLATGRVARMQRVEVDAALLDGTADDRVASLEHVPLSPESVDLVFSPLSLHLTNDTPGVLLQVTRALRPDGLFLAALPGSGTLAELRDVLVSAESEITGGAGLRVAPFADVRDAGALLQRAGFALPVADVETHVVRYDTMFALIRDLRAMAMTNPLSASAMRPLNRNVLLRAAQLYSERHADPDGRIRATMSIIYLSGWKPHESQQKPLKPGSATTRLADVLGRPSKG
jgi:SAM-dependent methyltransferase